MEPLFTSQELSNAASRAAEFEASAGELPVVGRSGAQVARASLQRILATERRLRIGVAVANSIALLATGAVILHVARTPLPNLPKAELERFSDRLATITAILFVAAAASIGMSVWSHVAERQLRDIAGSRRRGDAPGRIRVTP